ncbi:hypothetical protein [Parasitella parasitica]|uniref:Uncharacterized protein n=1 Tax=Parasitella parasitica TaxID=35722 RepID=A0A0B7NXB7_9FUNG|nr:hypothetical protein [Parasitella parasitica]
MPSTDSSLHVYKVDELGYETDKIPTNKFDSDGASPSLKIEFLNWPKTAQVKKISGEVEEVQIQGINIHLGNYSAHSLDTIQDLLALGIIKARRYFPDGIRGEDVACKHQGLEFMSRNCFEFV